MSIDFEALRGEIGGEPPDGAQLDATLTRIERLETSKGPSIVTEWQSTDAKSYVWTAWFGLTGTRIGFARDFLRDCGVNLKALKDEYALDDALGAISGLDFKVSIRVNGNFVNMDVLGRSDPQMTIDQAVSDMPAQNGDLPAPGAAAKAPPDDDDIPF